MQDKSTKDTLPVVVEVLDSLMKPSTVLEYQEKDIKFKNPISSVKSLRVQVSSTETLDQKSMSILHSLHTKIR